MKKLTILLLLFAQLTIYAQQAQQGFKWQGIAKDATGNAVTQPVTLTFTILQNNVPVYAETQSPIVPNAGQVAATVGAGAASQGSFAGIDWSLGTCSLNVKMKIGSGQVLDMGTSELMPVPFALYAYNGAGQWQVNGTNMFTLNKDVGIGTSDINAPLTVQGAISSGSRLFVGRNGTESGYSLLHFKNGDDAHGGIIRASKGGDDEGNAPLLFQAKSHKFNSQTTIIATAVGLPYINGNILDLASTNAPGALTFGKLNGNGDSYIQSSTSGNSSRLVLNPHGGGSTSVEIVGSVNGMPYVAGNILDIKSTSAEGGLVIGKLNQAGDSYIQSYKTGASSNLHINPHGQNTRVIVPILEITGGSDITEKVNSPEALQPGEVIITDPSQPNSVRRSGKAYDRTVLGVVSGAGGVSHGMELKQEGLLDGNTSFAIAGRVYVKTTGEVAPGDLLTTSDVPGHAMKATNRRKRDGAVIGKALTAPNGEGLVLMLVQTR